MELASIGFDVGVVAGAVISGAYFGDKMSPLSDTTNLAAAVAGSNLFDHIKYMMITTVPTICIALVFFVFYNLFNLPSENLNTVDYIESIKDFFFFISPILFVVPLIVVLMIIKKNKSNYLIICRDFSCGTFLIFQSELIDKLVNQRNNIGFLLTQLLWIL